MNVRQHRSSDSIIDSESRCFSLLFTFAFHLPVNHSIVFFAASCCIIYLAPHLYHFVYALGFAVDLTDLNMSGIEDWVAILSKMSLKRNEINLLIMDYLISEGFKEAAERFKTE